MNILLIGSGGREHALAWKLLRSPSCTKLTVAPGNAGIADIAECVSIPADDIPALVAFAKEKGIALVVVGPEGPLVAGLADAMRTENIPVFGPSKDAAILEGSKGFMKDLCRANGIPTAAYGRFSDIASAESFIRKTGAPIVVKADGLAAGKGVIIAREVDEAIEAARDMLSGTAFGESGVQIVVEEFLDGEEVSFFAITDGETVLPLACAQDHKRAFDGDTGPNTGGMGAYSPSRLMTGDLQQKIMDSIIRPTVEGMAAQGRRYTGVLFAGLMILDGAPFLIEYNVRFGDPECQTLMLRLESDLAALLHDAATGNLARWTDRIEWREEAALCVVMAAKGYPGTYEKGSIINALDKAASIPGVQVFHAGTVRNEGGDVVAAGGRVLGVTAIAQSVIEAQQKAYAGVDSIDWHEGFSRRDIGWRAV